MPQQAYPTLAGEAQSWANIGLRANVYDGETVDLVDIAGVDWDVTVERAVQRRIDGQIKARTHGQKTCTGKISFYADGWQTFLSKLVAKATEKGYVRNGVALYGQVPFDLVIQHTMLGDTAIKQVELVGCVIKKDVGAHAEGTDPDKNEVELDVIDVIRYVDGTPATIL